MKVLRAMTLLVLLSLPSAKAQDPTKMPVNFSFSLNPGGRIANLVGGWTQDMLATSNIESISSLAYSIEANGISLPTGSTWTVMQNPTGAAASSPCGNLTYWTPQSADPVGMVHELSIAMFTGCNVDSYDNLGILTEGSVRAKSYIVQQKLFQAGTPGFSPGTGLPMAAAKLAQRFFSAGGCISFIGTACIDRDSDEVPLEEGANKLGGTFVPIDQQWAQLPMFSYTGFDPDGEKMQPLLQGADQAVGNKIAGKNLSTLIVNTPTTFILDANQRSALGFGVAGDPTDGTHLEMYPLGALKFDGADTVYTVVNPIAIQFSLVKRKSGVTSLAPTQQMKITISDSFGNEMWSTIFTPTSSNDLVMLWQAPSPYAQVPCGNAHQGGWCPPASFADGAYSATLCVYDSSCGITQTQHFVIDHSNWSLVPGTMLVYTNGPDYETLNQTQLSLAGNPGYTLTRFPGVVVVSDIPNQYTEVSLTDGRTNRLFPYIPGSPQNLWDWKGFDDPNLLSGLNPATGKYIEQIAPGAALQLIGVGMSHDDPLSFRPFRNGTLPTATSGDDNCVRVVFTWPNGGKAFAGLNYVSPTEVDVMVPNIPIGTTASIQVELNGTLSNARQFTVIAGEPMPSFIPRPRKSSAAVATGR